MSGRFSRTIYVGNLPADIRESEIEDLFYKVCFKCFHVTLILVCRIMRFCSFSVSCVFTLIIVIDLRNNGYFYVLLIMYMPACYLILFP